MTHQGELAALLTAMCWTVTALAFESAARRVGSLPVNIIRLVFGFLFLGAFTLVTRNLPLPLDAGAHEWLWLSVSGLVGFVLGDLCLFQSFTMVGARVSMLVMTLAPPLAALGGWLITGDRMRAPELAGMGLTLGGIALVVTKKKPGLEKFSFSYSPLGLLLAFGGALGQAGGLVLSKFGMGGYDAFAATHIRIIAGLAGFAVIFLVSGKWRIVPAAAADRTAMARTALGAFFGPFLGVSLSLYALQHAATGVAATIMALVPVFLIVPSVFLLGERVGFKEIIGAFLAVAGTAVMFMA
ncbi:MAG: DMT family transporter [Spirochaetes bacterium]|nr:MAG: DMT family transporter [Spirochaetota bacterium]